MRAVICPTNPSPRTRVLSLNSVPGRPVVVARAFAIASAVSVFPVPTSPWKITSG